METKQIIGLDIGYGFTKATNSVSTAIFPSVAGDVVKADFANDVVKAGTGHVVMINGQAFFYGTHAQKHSRNPMALLARERIEQRELMRVLFCGATTELGIQGRVSLCTGCFSPLRDGAS